MGRVLSAFTTMFGPLIMAFPIIVLGVSFSAALERDHVEKRISMIGSKTDILKEFFDEVN